MASSGTLKSLARLGYVRSISDQYEEQEPDISDMLRNMLDELRSRCDIAIQCWRERLTHNDLRRIGAMLTALGKNTPLGKRRDITTFTAFGLCLLEDMNGLLKSPKKHAVDQVKRSLLDVHNYFAADGEEYQCLKAGAEGADVWDHTQM